MRESTRERIHRHKTGEREEENQTEGVRESPHMRMATRAAPASPPNHNDVNRKAAGQGNMLHRLEIGEPWPCRMECNMNARRDAGRAARDTNEAVTEQVGGDPLHRNSSNRCRASWCGQTNLADATCPRRTGGKCRA